jgi:myo-inositol-1(or 4)-monophosphatase
VKEFDLTQLYLLVRKKLESIGEYVCSTKPERVRTSQSGRDVTTNLDLAVADQLREFLTSLLPASVVVTEEDAYRLGDVPLGDIVWIVDPIDGTGNLITGYPVFAISAALIIKRQVVLGITYNPSNLEMFHAISGAGAFLNGHRISVTTTDDIFESLLSTGLSLNEEDRIRGVRALEALSPFYRDVRIGGSAALELAYVACGRVDCYFESKLAPWDLAAGKLLVSEAGGVVLVANSVVIGNVQRADVVASNRNLAKKWFEKIASLSS